MNRSAYRGASIRDPYLNMFKFADLINPWLHGHRLCSFEPPKYRAYICASEEEHEIRDMASYCVIR